MIHSIFEFCAQLLLLAGHALGIGYEAINVWVFVIVWPAMTVAMLRMIVWQRAEIQRLRRR